MGRISALTELTSLASDDYLVVLDSSANIAKKITVANAFGIQEFGWTATGESWTYASWTSGTRIGTITVPTDATTKYKAGDRIKITQSTGGTKYGIITKVAATLLTVFFPSGTTLNNEAITSPSYALAGVNPLNFPTDPTLWQLEATDTTLRSQNTPTTDTWYNLGSFNLPVGIGAWEVGYMVTPYFTRASAGAVRIGVTLSTANNTQSDAQMDTQIESNSLVYTSNSQHNNKLVNLSSATTFYLNTRSETAGADSIYNVNDRTAAKIYARCAYL